MITAVDFLSRAVFEALAPPAKGWAAVSIGNPAELPPAALFRFAPYLRLELLDLTPADLNKYDMPEDVLCQPEQVETFVQFVQGLHAHAEPYQLVIHCHAGSSRSAAFALLAHALTQCDFPRLPDAHFANEYIVALGQRHSPHAFLIPPPPTGLHDYLSSGLAI